MGEAIARWYAAGHRDLPWRHPDFPAWGILISEFMLQQTPVARVIPRLAEWLERWPTPADLAAVPPGEAVRAWDRLGYPRRALNLHAAAVAIAERHGNRVPTDVDELLELPGVGPYTARAVAAFAYGVRTPVVDTNVRRVLARAVDGQAEPGPPQTRATSRRWRRSCRPSRTRARLINAGTMELGQTVCTARSPRCEECPMAASCAWRAAGYPELRRSASAASEEVRGLGSSGARADPARAARRDIPVPAEAIVDACGRMPIQLERALAGLLRDGLVTGSDPLAGLSTPRARASV